MANYYYRTGAKHSFHHQMHHFYCTLVKKQLVLRILLVTFLTEQHVTVMSYFSERMYVTGNLQS